VSESNETKQIVFKRSDEWSEMLERGFIAPVCPPLVDVRVDVGEASSSVCVCVYICICMVSPNGVECNYAFTESERREENRRISINRSILITVCL
jgi:hypothetical protein